MSIIKPFRGTLLNKTHPLVRGLGSCWIMNEGSGDKIFDLAGNEHGTNSGADWIPTVKGSGLDFNGSSDYVEIANSSEILEFPTGSFSIEVGIIPSSDDLEGMIVFYGDTNDEWYAISQSRAPDVLQFVVDDDTTKTGVVESITVNVGQYYHLVGVRHVPDDNLYLYRDGELVATQTDGSGDISNPTYKKVYFGCKSGGGIRAEFWSGAIVFVRIYDIPLELSVIQRLYQEFFAIFEQPSPAKYFYVEAAPTEGQPAIRRLGGVNHSIGHNLQGFRRW